MLIVVAVFCIQSLMYFIKINCIFNRVCRCKCSLPKLSFKESCLYVLKPVRTPFKESLPVRGENSASSVKGGEEEPGSEYESSLFISFATKMTTA